MERNRNGSFYYYFSEISFFKYCNKVFVSEEVSVAGVVGTSVLPWIL